jgi:hypothetical protein
MTRVRVDVRLVAAAAAALVAGGIVLALTRPPATVDIVTAAAALPPGVPLSELPLETTQVRDRSGALLAGELDLLSGWVLAAALGEGDPVLESLVVPPPAGRHDTIGLSLRSDRAVHGDLVPGDTVAVYATRDELAPLRLAPAVLVLAAGAAGGGLTSSDVAVLLAVDDRLASQIIRAAAASSIHLVRVGR